MKTICGMLSSIIAKDLEHVNNAVVYTLLATDPSGLQDIVQRKLDDQRTAYRRTFTLIRSIRIHSTRVLVGTDPVVH